MIRRSRKQGAYAQAGVDISAGNRFAEMIAERCKIAWPDKAKIIGGFAGTRKLTKPTDELTACCDGAGTVAHLAAAIGNFPVIGMNAAAMSLTDCYCGGSHPVGLLDNINCECLLPDEHIGIVDGLISACQLVGDDCVIMGGETAELPGTFREPWMVLVDTAVYGVPDEGIVTQNVEPGQRVFGWLSHGLGSNGFSLARKVLGLRDIGTNILRSKMRVRRQSLGGGSFAKHLLRAAPIYVKEIELLRAQGVVFAAHAHITGGGLKGNIPRVLPGKCKVNLNLRSWKRPVIFDLIQQAGKVEEQEMQKVFNLGLMMVSIVESGASGLVHRCACEIGTVEERVGDEPQVQFVA